jgi:hypothetical protein
MPTGHARFVRLHWSVQLLLVFLAGTVLAAAGNYLVNVSSHTTIQKPPPKQSHPLHRQIKRLRAVGEKMFTPNPGFQGPHSSPMPTPAPLAPQLAPTPQKTSTERFLQTIAKVITTTWDNNIFVWLPAISTDPNTGPTYGILPVLVLSEPVHHHIRHLFAPSYTYNALFGETVTGRYYFYPTDQSQLYTTVSDSTRTNRTVKMRYEDSAFLGGRAYIRAEGYYDGDGSKRFFGVGPGTLSGGESGYTGLNKVIHTDMGVNFLNSWRASLGLRYRRMGTDPNIVSGIPDLATKYPGIPGLSEENTIVQEFHLLWDSRDYPVTPSRGSSGEIFFEKTTLAWGSNADYIRYGIEGKRFFPWMDGKQNTVIHGLYDWVNGPNIPFYELATLGGRDTLRGYGEGRFNDQGRILFNVEQRMELTTLSMMGVQARFEAGPFFDLGTVFPRPEAIERKDFRPVWGGSFRAVVKPNVVGSVDVGVGKEGIGVYVGIDYPF